MKGGGDLGNLMRQAQKMQERILELQEELGQKRVEASVGGGMVRVVANGKQEILSVRIEREVVNPQEAEMLEDLVVAGVNEALRLARELASAEMGKLTGGLKIPGLF